MQAAALSRNALASTGFTTRRIERSTIARASGREFDAAVRGRKVRFAGATGFVASGRPAAATPATARSAPVTALRIRGQASR